MVAQRLKIWDGTNWRSRGWELPPGIPDPEDPPDPETPPGGFLSYSQVVSGAGLENPGILVNSGGITVTGDGVTVQNLNIPDGIIAVKANGVTVKNCRVKGYSASLDIINIYPGFTNTQVLDCDLESLEGPDINKAAPGCVGGYGNSFLTVKRCNIHGLNSDGIKATVGAHIERNYVHMGKSPGSTVHLDGMQAQGNANNCKVINNVWFMPQSEGGNICVFFQGWKGAPLNQCTLVTGGLVQANYLCGGNIPLQLIGGKSAYCSNASSYITNFTVKDNVFYRDTSPLGSDTIRFEKYAVIEGSGHSISGNVDDLGAPVVAPYGF